MPMDRFVLEAAAAAGPQFTVEAVATVLGTHALRAMARRLDALVARECSSLPGYRFRHPIIVDLLACA
jgi:hypothetical protein